MPLLSVFATTRPRRNEMKAGRNLNPISSPNCKNAAPPGRLRFVELRAGRRQDFQSKIFRNLHHARNVLLLLRTHRADFLEESLEARRRDDAHEFAGCLAKVAVSVRNPTRRKNRVARLGNERLSADGPLVFAFENLKRFILAMVDVRRWSAARHIVRFDDGHRAICVAAMHADEHGNTKDIDGLAAVVGNLNRIHVAHELSC